MLPKLLLVPQESRQNEEGRGGGKDKSMENDTNEIETSSETDSLSMTDIESALVEYSIIFNELIRFVSLLIICFCRSLFTYLFAKVRS